VRQASDEQVWGVHYHTDLRVGDYEGYLCGARLTVSGLGAFPPYLIQTGCPSPSRAFCRTYLNFNYWVGSLNFVFCILPNHGLPLGKRKAFAHCLFRVGRWTGPWLMLSRRFTNHKIYCLRNVFALRCEHCIQVDRHYLNTLHSTLEPKTHLVMPLSTAPVAKWPASHTTFDHQAY
jgi:hypothetical protein